MSVQIRPSDTSHESCLFRQSLREKLNIQAYLKQRTAFAVGERGIHCELYEYSLDAPTILFLPGVGTYSELYAEMLFKLSQQGYNVVGIDPLGHGYSGGPRGDYQVAEMAQAVSSVLDVLEQRFQGSFGIFGYSMGALLAVAAATSDQRLSSVLCGTLLLPDLAPDMQHRMGWNWTWLSSLFMPAWKIPLNTFVDYKQLLKGHPAAEQINHDPLMVFTYPLRTLSSLFSYKCQLVQRQYPFSMAILHGEGDEVLPLDYSKRITQYCEHPIELMVMEKQGHMVPFLNPERVVGYIEQWFADKF